MLLTRSATVMEHMAANIPTTAYETHTEHMAANIPTTALITSTPLHHQ